MFLIFLRDKYINILKKKILLLEKDTEILDDKILLFFSNRLYHWYLKHYIRSNKINIVYELDNLIFYDENKVHQNIHCPILILNCTFEYNNKTYDITDNIKRYSFNVPIFIIMKLENINIDSIFKINILKKFKIITEEYNLYNIMYNKLFEIL
jgi:hypothetical protein